MDTLHHPAKESPPTRRYDASPIRSSIDGPFGLHPDILTPIGRSTARGRFFPLAQASAPWGIHRILNTNSMGPHPPHVPDQRVAKRGDPRPTAPRGAPHCKAPPKPPAFSLGGTSAGLPRQGCAAPFAAAQAARARALLQSAPRPPFGLAALRCRSGFAPLRGRPHS